MTTQDELSLKNEIQHIFDSGANEMRILEMVKTFIEKRGQALYIHDVMPSGFTLQQENAIWGVIQFLAKEQHKDPRKVRKRADVFKMIKDELDW